MSNIYNFSESNKYLSEINTWKKLYNGYRPKPDFSKVPPLSDQREFQRTIEENMIMFSMGWL